MNQKESNFRNIQLRTFQWMILNEFDQSPDLRNTRRIATNYQELTTKYLRLSTNNY